MDPDFVDVLSLEQDISNDEARAEVKDRIERALVSRRATMMNGEPWKKSNERRNAARTWAAEQAQSKQQEKVNKKIAATQKDLEVVTRELDKNDMMVTKALNSTRVMNCWNPTCTNTIPPKEMNSKMCDHCHIFVCPGAACLTNLQEEHIPTCPVAKLKRRKADAEKILTDLGAPQAHVHPQLDI